MYLNFWKGTVYSKMNVKKVKDQISSNFLNFKTKIMILYIITCSNNLIHI